jgi:hypothetical protein
MSSTILPFPQRNPPGVKTKRRPARLNAYEAIQSAAALEMIAAGIRALDEHLPCAGLPEYAPLLDHLWKQLPTVEAAAALIEDRADGGL